LKNSVLPQIVELPDKIKEKIEYKLRQKAILRARARLIENGVDIKDLSDEELEIIIKDEEDKLKDEYKTKGIFALLVILGISWF